MKIGIMMQSFDESMGGIGVYTREVVRAMLKIDAEHDYVLIFPGFGRARTHRGELPGGKNVTEVETYFPRLPGFLYSTRALAWIPRLLRKVRALVPVETYWDQVVVPRVARQHGVDVLFNPHLTVPIRGRFPKVTVLHAVEYHTVPNVYGWRMYVWWFVLERMIMPAADRLISLSELMTGDIRKHMSYPISQVRTIYHGVSGKFRVQTDHARLAQARERYRLPEKYLLFVGRLYPQKNFATLARAFASIKDRIPHRLVVAGQPRYKYEGEVRILDELGIDDRVDFLDHVPNDDLPMVYSLADCFVFPSLYESFGLVLVEAMACGCPVIGAKAAAIPEVSGGAALLFDPLDAGQLADAILKIVLEPEVRRDLVVRGLARAREFTWERTARQTLEVFRELV